MDKKLIPNNNNKNSLTSVNVTKETHDIICALTMIKHKHTIKDYINDLLKNEIQHLDSHEYQYLKIVLYLLENQ